MKIGGSESCMSPGPPYAYQDQDFNQDILVLGPENVNRDPNMLQNNNVSFTAKNLQLVYPHFDMAHFVVFPRFCYLNWETPFGAVY